MASHGSTRQKILNAAAELARTEGSAHLSLDAVAARAGVSKGGLLYNFPNKAALMKALVQQYIDEFEAALDARFEAADGQAMAAEYFRLAMAEMECAKPPPSGLLAALSEDPELLAPVRHFKRRLLDRLKADSPDETSVLLLFLVLEGLRSQMLFGTAILSQEERDDVLKVVGGMLDID